MSRCTVFDEKSDFFKSLKEFYIRVKSHGPTIIAGDFNARLHRRRSHEIDALGNYIFVDNNVHIDDVTSNRHLMIEICEELNLKIENSFFNHEEDEQVTYFDLASTPHTQISVSNFAQIDFFLFEDV